MRLSHLHQTPTNQDFHLSFFCKSSNSMTAIFNQIYDTSTTPTTYHLQLPINRSNSDGQPSERTSTKSE